MQRSLIFLQIILQKCLSCCKNTRRSALHFAVVSFFTFCISSHTTLVAHLLRARSNYHQYSSDRLHERILSLFTLSYYLFACVMCGIIYKKDIFDKSINSLCTQNIHYDTLCIVHYHIYAFLNLPSITLNIFLLYSDIPSLIFEQCIMHKENPYSAQTPL